MLLATLQQKILPEEIRFDRELLQASFESINAKGLFSMILIGVISISILTYFVALYSVFNSGFKTQAINNELVRVKQEVVVSELKLQATQNQLADNHKNVLESMESISGIIYLTPKSFVTTYSPLSP